MVGTHLVVFFFNKGSATPPPAATSAGSIRGRRRYSIQLSDGTVVYGSYHKLASMLAQRGAETVALPEPENEDEEHMMLAILLLTV